MDHTVLNKVFYSAGIILLCPEFVRSAVMLCVVLKIIDGRKINLCSLDFIISNDILQLFTAPDSFFGIAFFLIVEIVSGPILSAHIAHIRSGVIVPHDIEALNGLVPLLHTVFYEEFESAYIVKRELVPDVNIILTVIIEVIDPVVILSLIDRHRILDLVVITGRRTSLRISG